MKRNILRGLTLLLFISASLEGSNSPIRERLMGAAYLDNQAYHLLEEMSDRFGGRITGSASNEQSMTFIQEALEKEGIKSWQESFTFPGWVRGKDEAVLIEPVNRPLRAIALGYVQSHPSFSAEVTLIDKSKEEEITAELKGKIGLVPANVKLSTKTIDLLVNERGLKGLLLINRKNGGQLLARTQHREGSPSPIPVYTITEEEGHWLKRLIKRGETPSVQLTTRSETKPMRTANLVATLPGQVEEKIVIGAHFDSWDLGQGALDNGLGIAQAYDVARLLKAIHPNNHYTLEFVWFNAEEFGLYGSYAYMEKHKNDPIRAMINMDMVGDPIGINAMGFDSLIPFLEEFSNQLNALSFTRAMDNKPWNGSDHMPFIIQGIPSITLYAPINEASSRFYHDFGDTFDKVDETTLSKSIAIISLLAYELANDDKLNLPRLTEEETIALLRKAKLENPLRESGYWPFAD
ncbi:M28 family peptidase [Opitutia bacterium ISCC 51]|nr:M28 family peptidase [Opitutae bacterium ISCC 51]QXD27198.1 M28 family peptidase [Opitutae bacterium ISCC 52]